MATKTIPQLTALGAAPDVLDLIEIADTSAASASKSITVANLFTSPTFTGTTTAAALTTSGQIAGPAGSVAAPSFSFSANSNLGLAQGTSTPASQVMAVSGGAYQWKWGSAFIATRSDSIFGWQASTAESGAFDTTLSRSSAGVAQLGTTTSNALGSLLLTGLTATGAVIGYSGTAIPAGGTTGTGLKFSSTSNYGVFFGSGAPTLSAAQGSLYLRSDGAPQYNTNGTTGWTTLGGGSGDVVGPASATDNAVVRFDATTGKLVQDSVVTIADTTGNISSPGTLSVGVGGSTAGAMVLTQGTTQSTGTTNITLQAPAAVTSYIATLPGAVGSTGVMLWTVSGSVATLSSTTTLPSGTAITNAALTTPVLGTPSSGTLSACTVDGTNLVGFRGIPQNSQTAAYTTVLADAGKCIFHPSSDNNARTFTIDSNANVAYVIGTVIKFKNMAAASATIAITSDTMTLLPAGTTGSRTLAQYGEAYAEKISSTAWTISGNSALT